MVDLILGDVALAWPRTRGRAAARCATGCGTGATAKATACARRPSAPPALAGGRADRLRVVGAGSRALLREWAAAGVDAAAGWEAGPGAPADAAEMPWLGAVLA